jgi:hypothetical protein
VYLSQDTQYLILSRRILNEMAASPDDLRRNADLLAYAPEPEVAALGQTLRDNPSGSAGYRAAEAQLEKILQEIEPSSF